MMLRNPLVLLVACSASASPVRACALAGRIARTSRTTCAGVYPGRSAIEIESSLPTLPNSCWATEKSKIAIVAPPSEDTPPILAMPAIRIRCSAPRAITPIVSPTA